MQEKTDKPGQGDMGKQGGNWPKEGESGKQGGDIGKKGGTGDVGREDKTGGSQPPER
jgi:hypothetical protein